MQATAVNPPWNLERPPDEVTADCFVFSRKLLGKRKSGSDDRKISVPMIMKPSHQAPTKRGSFLSIDVSSDVRRHETRKSANMSTA